MQTPLQIMFRNMESSPALESAIRRHVEELDELFDRITSCRVVIEIPHRHQQKGQHVHLRVELHVPGKVLVVNRDPAQHDAHEDAYVAIRDAFRAARRELRDYAGKQQRKVKLHESPYARGRVSQIFVDKGYGFLKTSDSRDVYFHENSLRDKALLDLQVGDEVDFSEEPGQNGPQAIFVSVRGSKQQKREEDLSI